MDGFVYGLLLGAMVIAVFMGVGNTQEYKADIADGYDIFDGKVYSIEYVCEESEFEKSIIEAKKAKLKGIK